MVDYLDKNRRPPLKRAAVRLLEVAPVNRAFVALVKKLPTGAWRNRIPVVGGEAQLKIPGRRALILVRTDKCKLARELYWNDGEMALRSDALSLSSAMALAADAELFLDIGAYTGLFALAAARAQDSLQCHAYEILPENSALIQANIAANHLENRVECRRRGLGKKPGRIMVPADFGSGVLPSSVALDSEAESGLAVEVTTLDSEYPDFSGRMVCKLDVETFELDVLEGGQGLMARVLPDLICEVLSRSKKTGQLQAFLSKLGYSFFHISSAGILPAEEIIPDKRDWNWLFTTRSVAELRGLGVEVGS